MGTITFLAFTPLLIAKHGVRPQKLVDSVHASLDALQLVMIVIELAGTRLCRLIQTGGNSIGRWYLPFVLLEAVLFKRNSRAHWVLSSFRGGIV